MLLMYVPDTWASWALQQWTHTKCRNGTTCTQTKFTIKVQLVCQPRQPEGTSITQTIQVYSWLPLNRPFNMVLCTQKKQCLAESKTKLLTTTWAASFFHYASRDLNCNMAAWTCGLVLSLMQCVYVCEYVYLWMSVCSCTSLGATWKCAS